MMCEFNPKNNSRFIDPCMRNMIQYLKDSGIKTISCCCGHGIYPMSIIVQSDVPGGFAIEIMSGTVFHKTTRFYRKDKNGVYYIPEVSMAKV